MMSKSETLRSFVLQHLDRFGFSANGGPFLDLPKFELYAQDYLEFAEQELLAFQRQAVLKHKSARLINCVAHLKRALDCQLDTFFHVYNLYHIFAKRNLKFEKKLEFEPKNNDRHPARGRI